MSPGILGISRLAVAAVALHCIGCAPATLTICDTFAIPGMTAVLSAKVEHKRLGDYHGLPGIPVRFLAHDAEIGRATTDEMGQATLTTPLPAGVTQYDVVAHVRGEEVRDLGQVFTWSPGRAAIVCDIDETVSWTDYETLLDGEMSDEGSEPFEGAAETLHELTKRHDLIYLTARPGCLRHKTQDWLKRHGFPSAPLVTTPGLHEILMVQKFKAGMIRRIQEAAPTLVIGIGNARTDSEAYAQNGLLTLILNDADDHKFRTHAIALRNWRAVREFFEANREMLENPNHVRAAIEKEEMIRRPIVRYRRTHAH